MRRILFALLCLAVLQTAVMQNEASAKEIPFTQEDRYRLIRLEVKIEQIDKRFEQIDKRFDDLKTFLWIITAIFTAIMTANMGFAYWDRRTIIGKAKEEALAEIERKGKLNDLISALKDPSNRDEELAKVLKKFNLL